MRIELPQRTANAQPGTPFDVEVEVLNTSTTIDGVSVRLVGLDPAWVVADPPQLALFPDTTGIVHLRVTIPPEFPAGRHEIGVDVSSSVTGEAAYATLWLDVAPVRHAALLVAPSTVVTRRRATYRVIAENTGNTPVALRLSGADTERTVRFAFSPSSFEVPPGSTVVSQLDVAGKRRWFGTALNRNLDIVAETDDPEEQLDTRAVLTQRPVISRGVLTAMILGAIVALWAIVFLLAGKSIFSQEEQAKAAPASFFAATPASATGAPSGGAPAGALSRSGGGNAEIGGSITGTVTAKSTGKGVGRITVQAIRESKNGPILVASAATDDTGVYTLLGVLPGKYKVHFQSTGFTDVWYPAAPAIGTGQQVKVSTVDQTKGIDAVITGLPGSITGKVDPGFTSTPVTVTVSARAITASTSSSGAAAPPATQTSPTPATTPIQGTVDPSTNQFLLPGLPTPNTYELTFLAPGYTATTVTEELAGGQNLVSNTIRLSAANGSISGLVTDGVNPLGGVVVTAVANGKATTSATPTAGAVGRFTLTGLTSPATYLVTFVKDGFGSETAAIDLGPGQDLTSVNITLTGGTGSISGVALDGGTNQGLGDATISVTGGTTSVATKTLTAGLVGGYTVSGLPTPGNYTVTFSKDGYGTQTVPVTLSSSGLAKDVNATLPRTLATITGAIRSFTDNTLIPNAIVTVTDGTTAHTAVSASLPDANQHNYTVVGLNPGVYAVTVTAQNFTSNTTQVTVGAGQVLELNVVLKPSGP